jgi:uncharacterized protein YdeI (YjbR/CyaY-like superfamily)
MQPAGLEAFQDRKDNRSGIYSYEQRPEKLDEPYETLLKKKKAAWKFFYDQTPSYRRAAVWFVISAKTEATRLRRLDQLIEASQEGRWLKQYVRQKSR